MDAPGFQLHPWIFDRAADRGIQEHDPASKGISSYLHLPAEPFIRHFKLTAPTHIAWLDASGRAVLDEENR